MFKTSITSTPFTSEAANRKKNLRCCERSENDRNRSLYSCNTSGVAGVYFDKQRKKWVASITYKEDTMQRVGEFEKVSFEQFRDAMKDEFYRGQELPPAIEDDLKKMWEEIALPSRATTGSAGYDFKAPFTFEMRPGETMKIPTGIRVKIDEGWWLGCLPRSGLGFKFRMQFDNTMGVIDSDYYFSDNEGHIFAKITNDSKSQKIVHVEAGNGFMQAIFIPYGITYSDDATGVRNGGMGSTDSKA